jgi:hypothetical protein
LFILTGFSDVGTVRLDCDKATNIPRMDGGVFGSAWLKLQQSEAALAVRLLVSCGPSLLSLSLFCYIFSNLHPMKVLIG